MKSKRFLTVAGALLLASQMFAGSAGAVHIDYDEAVSGDLANNVGVTEFELDLGTNTVSGNASAAAGSNGPFDFDDMILTIQPGQLLTSAAFSWTLNTGTEVQTQFRFHDGTTISDPVLSGIDTVFLGSAGNSGAMGMFTLTLPLAAGSYLLNQLSIGVLDNLAADFDWTWTFNVEVVPLPPAVWLFSSGLLAMVGLSRRRRAT